MRSIAVLPKPRGCCRRNGSRVDIVTDLELDILRIGLINIDLLLILCASQSDHRVAFHEQGHSRRCGAEMIAKTTT